jgi:uncharacterized protein YbaP (TraB family)
MTLLQTLRRFVLILAAVAVFAGPATAQTSPWSNGPPPWAQTKPSGESQMVAELEVVKRLPGPALWRVTRGGSEVIILGSLQPLPHLLAWDTSRIENALDGANALLVPPEPKAGVMDVVGFVFNRGALELHGKTLQTVLPPPEQARFQRLMTTIHASPEHYEHWKPAIAGFVLIGDWRKAVGLSDAKPISTVVKLAQAEHVPIRHVGDFAAAPLVKTIAGLSDAASLACFDAALDDIDREAAHAPAAAKAWANADLKAVGQAYSVSVFERCLMQSPSVQNLVARDTALGVQEIEEALTHPGKTVAIIDLSFLIPPGGILDQLKAKGETITVPKG